MHPRPSDRYAATFGLMAVASLVLALWHGGVWLVLIWPAVNFAWLSVCYALRRPRWIGKAESGTIGVVPALVLLPYLLATWGLWHLIRVLSREAPSHEVAPGLWIGRRPLHHEVPPGVERVVDLTAEFPTAVHGGACEYRCVPMLDADLTDASPLHRLVDDLVEDRRPTLVHCASGYGRSAMVVAAVLVRRGDARSVADAMQLIRSHRPIARLNATQRRVAEALTQMASTLDAGEPRS